MTICQNGIRVRIRCFFFKWEEIEIMNSINFDLKKTDRNLFSSVNRLQIPLYTSQCLTYSWKKKEIIEENVGFEAKFQMVDTSKMIFNHKMIWIDK